MTNTPPLGSADGGIGTSIVDLRAIVVRAPVEEPVRLSFGTLDHRLTVFVEVELANGMIGVGESWVNWPPWAHVERVTAYEEGLRPLLIGRDALQIGSIRRLLESRFSPMSRQAGAVGPMHQAISGVDLALWDLSGKITGKSVAELCGGRRSTVPVYASSIGPGSQVESTCEALVDVGFSTVKVRVGFGRDTDRELLSKVRACTGDGFVIIADANRAWTLDEAREMADVLLEHGVSLIEEPLQDPTLVAIERLHDFTGLPVAMGENLYDEDEFLRFAESPAIGALQPDVTKNGGLSLVRAVGAIAATTGCTLMPHCYGGPLGFIASVHVMAGLGLDSPVEFPVGPSAPFWNMVDGQPAIHDGIVEVGEGPGFGFGMDGGRMVALSPAALSPQS